MTVFDRIAQLVPCLVAACNAGPLTPFNAPVARTPWPVHEGWRSELLSFPLEFAPTLPYRGVEEIRFAPGFFDPEAPGYWSYAFAWRLEAYPAFEPTAIGAQLTTYFRGLVAAVDEGNEITDRDSIVVRAAGTERRLTLTAHVIDPFTTKRPVDLTGTALQMACPTGALWVFTFAPANSTLHRELDALAARAACQQPPVPNAPRPGR